MAMASTRRRTYRRRSATASPFATCAFPQTTPCIAKRAELTARFGQPLAADIPAESTRRCATHPSALLRMGLTCGHGARWPRATAARFTQGRINGRKRIHSDTQLSTPADSDRRGLRRELSAYLRAQSLGENTAWQVRHCLPTVADPLRGTSGGSPASRPRSLIRSIRVAADAVEALECSCRSEFHSIRSQLRTRLHESNGPLTPANHPSSATAADSTVERTARVRILRDGGTEKRGGCWLQRFVRRRSSVGAKRLV